MLKLVKRNNTICVNKMKDGQIAEIISTVAGFPNNRKGQLIQLHNTVLIGLGVPHGNSWSDLFGQKGGDVCMVRVIEDGETFTIENNANPRRPQDS